MLNRSNKESGEFSPVTALLATVGNFLRVYTTIMVTGDVILLWGSIVGGLINGVRWVVCDAGAAKRDLMTYVR